MRYQLMLQAHPTGTHGIPAIDEAGFLVLIEQVFARQDVESIVVRLQVPAKYFFTSAILGFYPFDKARFTFLMPH
jgi:hypothetical protein